MKKSWTNGLDEDRVEYIKGAFASSNLIRSRLEEMIQQRIGASYKLSRAEYDCPNWTLLQADSVGYRRALEEIISLIEN